MATAEYLAPATWNGKAKHAPAEFGDRVCKGFTRVDLAQLFAKRGFTKGVEIGVADGRNALTLCQNIPGLTLTCVDPWEPYHGNTRGGSKEQHERNWHLAHERLEGYDVVFWQEFSLEAAQEFPNELFDFCYIDANHAFDWVMVDIIEWSKKVRRGGIVAGHDFYHFDRAGVVDAVVAYTKAHGILNWALTDEREPSFWWVKR